MADIDPRSPEYRQTEVVTDPTAEEAVQIPRGANDGSDPGPNPLADQTPNEFFGDEVEPQPSEPARSVGADVPAVPPEVTPEERLSYEEVVAEQEAEADEAAADSDEE